MDIKNKLIKYATTKGFKPDNECNELYDDCDDIIAYIIDTKNGYLQFDILDDKNTFAVWNTENKINWFVDEIKINN